MLHDGRVYFAAGVWPLEGTFVFCLDAATGEPVWRNDRASRAGDHRAWDGPEYAAFLAQKRKEEGLD